MTIELTDLHRMSVADVAALEASDLMRLQSTLDHQINQAKALKQYLDGAIAHKYSERVQEIRMKLAKDSGIVHFMDEGVRVSADLPKKPEWNQARLAEIAEQISEQGDDPAEYLEVTRKVSERKYNAWPEHIRNVFAPARILKFGKPSFRLSEVERVES